MRSDVLERVALDLLSIPPLIFRRARRKLVKTTLANIDLDITPQHFEIMRLLMAEGTMHIAQIGGKLQIAKAQMTKLIDKLVNLSMVERKIDMADRRTTNVTLTSQGRAFAEERRNNMRRAVRETLSGLTDEELEDLSDALRRLQDILSKLQ